MESKWEFHGNRADEQWVREITEDGRTLDHGPFKSYSAAKEFVKLRKAEQEADRHDEAAENY